MTNQTLEVSFNFGGEQITPTPLISYNLLLGLEAQEEEAAYTLNFQTKISPGAIGSDGRHPLLGIYTGPQPGAIPASAFMEFEKRSRGHYTGAIQGPSLSLDYNSGLTIPEIQ